MKYSYPFPAKLIILTLWIMCILFLAGCKEEEQPNKPAKQPEPPTVEIAVPPFNADSAYHFIEQQVDFGPRVPGTEAHAQTAEWLKSKLTTYIGTENVHIQKAKMKLFNGKVVDGKNIIGTYNPGIKTNRILLYAHWDTRMFADHDIATRETPIDGANDGGSGVGVLLEIARQLHLDSLNLGIDIIFFDVEDQGVPDNMGYRKTANSVKTWCLGSQYWSNNRHRPDFKYRYGILLDMVGAKNAVFPKEGYSRRFAPRVVDKVWTQAANLGYGHYFLRENAPHITDDHYFVNTMANIPSIDIIHLDPRDGSFGSFWHTHSDNMAIIGRPTLKAVGETVMHVVWKESGGAI